MADEDRTFQPRQAEVNRARQQGLGVGQTEMDLQRDPDRNLSATDPERTEPFLSNDEAGAPNVMGGSDQAGADDDRNAAGVNDGPILGEGTPANVDIHKLGERDNPQADWGDEVEEGATFSSTNTRRGVHTEGERGQGAKTRQLNKDTISRRV
jgi:hypothetical protein